MKGHDQLFIHDKHIVHMKITKSSTMRSVMKSVYNNTLKVTLSISCRAEKVPGFISWAEWQIQYNASLRSEHFTVGPSMWPWFRWMSTSHLYSSNQQLLTETHAHTQSHWLSFTLSLSSALSASSAHYAAETSERKRRDSRHKGDLLPNQPVHSTPTVRESVILAPASDARSPGSFLSLPGRSGEKGPPSPDPQTPQHPAHAISRFKLCLYTQKFKYTICNNSDIKEERRGLH